LRCGGRRRRYRGAGGRAAAVARYARTPATRHRGTGVGIGGARERGGRYPHAGHGHPHCAHGRRRASAVGRARSTEPPRATGRTRSGGRVPARRARACRCAAGGSPMIAAVSAVARADFLDRARRPAFPVTVFGALALGFLAVPPESARYAMVKVGTFRGVYDSAYIGTMLAMIGSLWLPLFGFYVVRNALGRDTASGVGELLAATPVRTPAYLLGKYLGNLAVLGAMAAALAAIAPVMQLLRGESTTIDPIGLWLPLVLFCLPALAVGAAAAVVFESIP